MTKPRSRTSSKRSQGPTRTAVIDIGGTGIKGRLINARGTPLGERQRLKTPSPAKPEAVLEIVQGVLEQLGTFTRLSVGFPGVVQHGVVHTAPNLHQDSWPGFPLQERLHSLFKVPTRVINDADLQGYGVIEGKGVEMVLTLGTGLGAALFTNGVLVPNLELGHHPFKNGKTYEQRVSDRQLKRLGKQRWSKRVYEVLQQLEPIFNYDRLHLGGGNARKLRSPLPDNVTVFENAHALRGGHRLWRGA